MIQLTQRQDISAQKTQLERKIREIHRIVKSLGVTSVLPISPTSAIIKKSPKKANLLNISLEGSPERPSSSLDFISTRSKPRSLNAGPSRVAYTGHETLATVAPAETQSPDAVDHDATESGLVSEVAESNQVRRESRVREREREARRSSRRMSRASGEIVPLSQLELQQDISRIGDIQAPSTGEEIDRIAKKKTRYANGTSTPIYSHADNLSSIYLSPARTDQHLDNEDKENAVCQRKSTASIKSLHSSPVKNRTALNVIVDPLPCTNNNIPVVLQTQVKPLIEVAEVKYEPTSPQLDAGTLDHTTEDSNSRSRRGKTVNYAEPSLRVKMRRTESLPGDKRRKSTYRRVEESRTSSTGRTTITIDED